MPPIAKDVLGRINRDFVHTGREMVSVREREEKGRGTVVFAVSSPCLCVQPPKDPVKWLHIQKCADGAIIEFAEDGVHLHLVEMKSKVGAKEWNDIKKQFHGAYLNLLAIGAVLELPAFASVTLHLAYTRDRVSPQNSTAPSMLKLPLGEPKWQGVADWIGRRVDLGGLGNLVPLRLIQRDDTGDAQAGLR